MLHKATEEQKRQMKFRLWEIEHELDKTEPWEGSPYRYHRQKLNREKVRLLRVLADRDPRFSATGVIGYTGGLTREQQRLYDIKKGLMDLMDLVDPPEEPQEWWEGHVRSSDHHHG